MKKSKAYIDFMDSAAGGAIDQSLSMTPGVNIIWGAMKNTVNQTANIRIIRGIEFFEICAEKGFIQELEKSEQALDGLAICFETFIKERNEEKREIIKNIFLGFIQLSEEKKEKFELERLLDVVNKITPNEIILTRTLYKEDIREIIFTTNDYEGTITFNSFHFSNSKKFLYEEIKAIENLGLVSIIQKMENPLKKSTKNKIKIMETIPFSKFGSNFIKYITK